MTFKVVMPPDHGPEVQALWRQLAEQADFDPRTAWEDAR